MHHRYGQIKCSCNIVVHSPVERSGQPSAPGAGYSQLVSKDLLTTGTMSAVQSETNHHFERQEMPQSASAKPGSPSQSSSCKELDCVNSSKESDVSGQHHDSKSSDKLSDVISPRHCSGSNTSEPISMNEPGGTCISTPPAGSSGCHSSDEDSPDRCAVNTNSDIDVDHELAGEGSSGRQIGRASCRERV